LAQRWRLSPRRDSWQPRRRAEGMRPRIYTSGTEIQGVLAVMLSAWEKS
jgi:hypothetical protein